MPGFRSFQIVDERKSLWTLKIGFGALVRTVKVRVRIVTWCEPDRVTFTDTLDVDPVVGDGHYAARLCADGTTQVKLAIRISGQGRFSTLWEAKGRPILPKMVIGFADSLKAGLEENGAAADGQSLVEKIF